MDKFEALKKEMCQELEAIEQKVKAGTEMSINDLEKIDKLTHALKSLATWLAMEEAEGYSDGMSGRRGRAANGRYVSMDGGSSYAEGYSRGYSEGMAQSGHWPGMMPDPRFRY